MVIRTRIESPGSKTLSHEIAPSVICLFFSFLKLGATAFGGPAMVPYIGKMAVEQKHWLNAQTFRDGVALCQIIPGATAMQTAAYVGFRMRGVAGAAASFIRFGLPAFLLMVGLADFYVRSATLPPIAAVFHGLQVIVVALVANATISFGKTSLKGLRDGTIATIAAAMFGLGLNPILVIIWVALLGLVIFKKNAPPMSGFRLEMTSPSTRPLLILVSATALAFGALFLVDRKLFDLAALMFRIDLFAFGGGFGSVPLMFHEIVEVRSWMDAQTFLNGIALGQVTPGPIVITATFVGYILYGPLGAMVATFGVFVPSFLIVTGITPYFDKLSRSSNFSTAIHAILCSFVGLLLAVTFRFGANISWDIPLALLATAAFVALIFKVETVWIVLVGTVVSMLLL